MPYVAVGLGCIFVAAPVAAMGSYSGGAASPRSAILLVALGGRVLFDVTLPVLLLVLGRLVGAFGIRRGGRLALNDLRGMVDARSARGSLRWSA
jgi:hypothetical protein